jgi:hypothetical protein
MIHSVQWGGRRCPYMEQVRISKEDAVVYFKILPPPLSPRKTGNIWYKPQLGEKIPDEIQASYLLNAIAELYR